jgi:hypothetical protein
VNDEEEKRGLAANDVRRARPCREHLHFMSTPSHLPHHPLFQDSAAIIANSKKQMAIANAMQRALAR